MDQWFNQLFEIIGRQNESKKTEMLLPEIYGELDILTRKQNIIELQEIYEFVEKNSPINTEDPIYNKSAYTKLKKEILKRHVMLRDFSVINRDINKLLLTNNQKEINKMLNVWKDSKYVYNYLQETIFNSKQTKKVSRPEQAKKTVKVKPPVVRTKPIEKPEPKPETVEPIEVSIVSDVMKPVLTKKVEVSQKEPELRTIVKPKVDSVPEVKVVEPKPVIEERETITDAKPVVIVPPKDPYELFFDCIAIISKRYKMTVNVEMLRKLSNPKPNFSRFLLQYIDEQDRNSRFFIELFKLLTEYDLIDLITYILNKSFKIKKLCTYNIGLLNETDLETKYELLDIIVKQDFDFIKMSDYERKVRLYIENLHAKDNTTEDIQKRVFEISKFAPLMMQTFYASDAIGFFKINIDTVQDRIIESDNLSHLYWSMLLAVSLSVYVLRDKYTDFISSMDCIADMANLLIKKTDDLEIKYAVKTLATSYIRRIYKIGTKLPEYEEWWDRHKDDMLESKHKGLAILNPID
jgi:hypothetical protein